MKRHELPCPRCGVERSGIEITTYGDREPNFIAVECDCPGPRCPFCTHRLENELCDNSNCFMWRTIIPVPDFA